MLRIAGFLIAILISAAASAQTSTELQKRKATLTKEIERLNKSLKQTSGNKNLSLKQVNTLTREIKLRENKIVTINLQIGLLDNQISTNTQTVQHLQNNLAQLRKQYAEMIRFAAKTKDSYTTLMFIFSSKDFNQAVKRLKYLAQFNAYRRKQANQIKGTQQEITVKIGELDKDKKEKSELLSDEVQEKQTLGKKKDRQAKELQRLTTTEKQLQKQLTARQSELKKLDAQIKATIQKEIAAEKKRLEAIAAAKAAAAKKANPSAPAPKATASAGKSSNILASTPEAAKLSASFVGNKGSLPWPVAAGRISEGFGQHTYGVDVKIYNTGIDIETSPGAGVRAVFAGDVFSVTNFEDSWLVMIRHGEYITVYSHLKSVTVSRGQTVSTRQSIGTVMGTKLHFEVRKGVAEMNPSAWIAK
jgi:septal ring factor EnvC (AmiA/AmiB activator)